MTTILFLCTGNYYRSRYAELLFNARAAELGLPHRAESRGLATDRGMNNFGPMARCVVEAMANRKTPVAEQPESSAVPQPIQVAVEYVKPVAEQPIYRSPVAEQPESSAVPQPIQVAVEYVKPVAEQPDYRSPVAPQPESSAVPQPIQVAVEYVKPVAEQPDYRSPVAPQPELKPLRFPIQVAVEDLQAAQGVIAVKEAEHRPLLSERYPGWEDRVEYWHVHDIDFATVPETLAAIEEMVEKLLKEMTASEK